MPVPQTSGLIGCVIDMPCPLDEDQKGAGYRCLSLARAVYGFHRRERHMTHHCTHDSSRPCGDQTRPDGEAVVVVVSTGETASARDTKGDGLAVIASNRPRHCHGQKWPDVPPCLLCVCGVRCACCVCTAVCVPLCVLVLDLAGVVLVLTTLCAVFCVLCSVCCVLCAVCCVLYAVCVLCAVCFARRWHPSGDGLAL